ncbi:MAG: hypothetical protein ACXWP5_10080 [Bdellovibrionota bacterium]
MKKSNLKKALLLVPFLLATACIGGPAGWWAHVDGNVYDQDGNPQYGLFATFCPKLVMDNAVFDPCGLNGDGDGYVVQTGNDGAFHIDLSGTLYGSPTGEISGYIVDGNGNRVSGQIDAVHSDSKSSFIFNGGGVVAMNFFINNALFQRPTPSQMNLLAVKIVKQGLTILTKKSEYQLGKASDRSLSKPGSSALGQSSVSGGATSAK